MKHTVRIDFHVKIFMQRRSDGLTNSIVSRLMHVLTDVVVCRRVNLRYVKRFQDLGDSDNVADLNGLLESNCFTSNPLQLPCDNCYRLRSLKPGLNDINGKEYVVEDRNVSNEMKRIVMCINEIVQCTVLESLYVSTQRKTF